MRIDTADDYRRAVRSVAQVTSRTHGAVPVPCTQTWLVRRELVQANTYNPNHVPEDKMHLLQQSILDNGFCFPLVTIWDDETGVFVIVDGFHRHLVAGPDWLDLDYVPVVVLEHDTSRRMAATMQFNKARGVHQVDLDADVIRALIEQGMSEEDVAIHVGLDLDAVHRYKQLTGVASLFARAEYSRAWEMTDDGA